MDKLTVVDMHTGGEPLRIVIGGYPPIPAGTILEKRAWVRDNLDHLRKILIFEPRGHYDMYGALMVEPNLPGADLAVLFMHNEGYSTMCGHATIALLRRLEVSGQVPAAEPGTRFGL
jgi:proline racemase